MQFASFVTGPSTTSPLVGNKREAVYSKWGRKKKDRVNSYLCLPFISNSIYFCWDYQSSNTAPKEQASDTSKSIRILLKL